MFSVKATHLITHCPKNNNFEIEEHGGEKEYIPRNETIFS
jgi:hypothetical protein